MIDKIDRNIKKEGLLEIYCNLNIFINTRKQNENKKKLNQILMVFSLFVVDWSTLRSSRTPEPWSSNPYGI